MLRWAMIVKRIVILANSIKHQKRCVAGREVWFKDGKHRLGAWVRPVSSTGKGEIALEQSTLPDGSQPAVLEIIDVPLSGHAEDPTQPENWNLSTDKPWHRVTTVPPVPLEMLREEPAELWHEWNQNTDRISNAAVLSGSQLASLYMIKPRNFRLVASIDRDGPAGQDRRRRRAVFEYGKDRYNLSVTDPTVDDRYLNPFPRPSEVPRKVVLPSGDNCLLCVSRTPMFNDGNHYKIVATVIEMGA